MANMANEKVKMPVQDGIVRSGNFDEVALGYDEAMAVEEATRCLNCVNRPCVSGCPVKVKIPDFIAEVAKGDFKKAYEVIHETSSLPAVCGRVCPQETQCEQKCVRGIKGESVAIGRLERFVADWYRKNCKEALPKPQSNGHKVAVVGSGPAGLTCAGDLAKLGYQVSVFEALHVAGGVLMYGIPEFRLPKEIVQHEIEGLKQQGVEIECNTVIGRSESVDELFEEGYEAVFIGSGAGLPNFMNLPGENLKGVYSANEFLTRCNLMKAYQEGVDTPIQRPEKAVIVGGGNVAMDAVRTAKRLGAERAIIAYRRTEDEMPARKAELHHAKAEGVEVMPLVSPLEFLKGEDGNVCGVRVQKMELGEPDESGRRRPVPIEGAVEEIPCDVAISAIGTNANPFAKKIGGMELNKWGYIIADEETGRTSNPKIWAGGDIVTGAATVILAMGAGKKAAADMTKVLTDQE